MLHFIRIGCVPRIWQWFPIGPDYCHFMLALSFDSFDMMVQNINVECSRCGACGYIYTLYKRMFQTFFALMKNKMISRMSLMYPLLIANWSNYLYSKIEWATSCSSNSKLKIWEFHGPLLIHIRNPFCFYLKIHKLIQLIIPIKWQYEHVSNRSDRILYRCRGDYRSSYMLRFYCLDFFFKYLV